MCTVSFIVKGDEKYFTSNRDENKLRPAATMPKSIYWNGKKLILPQDPHAGGSWFAIAENGTIGILLNGAFEKHTPLYPYRKSRGLVLLDMVVELSGHDYFEQYDLTDIEPFTIIIFVNEQLFEFRWDSIRKFSKQLTADNNYIWSSTTLYDAAATKKREKLFQDFTTVHSLMNAELIRSFHSNNNGDYQNGFIINRESGIKTQCITQAIVQKDQILFIHHDLISGQQQEQMIDVKKSTIICE